MTDRDRRHGNDPGYARLIRPASTWQVTTAVWQNALAEDWYSALAQLVLAGRQHPRPGAGAPERTMSVTTWHTYKRTLRLWLRYLDAEARTDDPSTHTVIAYRTWLRTTRPHLSISTINNRLDTIQAFYRWTAAVERFPDIAASVTAITDPRSAPLEVLAIEDVRALVDRIDDRSVRDLRNRALIWLLFGGALETISLHRANVADLDCARRTLRHQPRGYHFPAVVTDIPQEAVAAMTRYLARREPDVDEPLFTSTRHVPPQRLSTLSMRLTVRRILDVAHPRQSARPGAHGDGRGIPPSALRIAGLCHRLGGPQRLALPGALDRLPITSQGVGYRSIRAAHNLIKRCLP